MCMYLYGKNTSFPRGVLLLPLKRIFYYQYGTVSVRYTLPRVLPSSRLIHDSTLLLPIIPAISTHTVSDSSLFSLYSPL
jgi:hypothetical protein